MSKNKKINTITLINLVTFFVISIISIYSATKLTTSSNDILIRQVIWYLIGFLIIFITFKFNINWIINKAFIFYIIGNILLLLLLFFGKEINGSKCWFSLPGIGSFQPSEFMKLILILVNTKLFKIHNKKYEKSTFKSASQNFMYPLYIILWYIIFGDYVGTFWGPSKNIPFPNIKIISYFIIYKKFESQ